MQTGGASRGESLEVARQSGAGPVANQMYAYVRVVVPKSPVRLRGASSILAVAQEL